LANARRQLSLIDVVILSAGKEAAVALTTTLGLSAPAGKTSQIQTGPGEAGIEELYWR
jgi:hypothetical protein